MFLWEVRCPEWVRSSGEKNTLWTNWPVPSPQPPPQTPSPPPRAAPVQGLTKIILRASSYEPGQPGSPTKNRRNRGDCALLGAHWLFVRHRCLTKLRPLCYCCFLRKYVLQGIIGMQQTIDEAKGDRFLIELRLGLRAHSNASVRMSKYVFLARGADDLCFPKGYEVNRTTNVYFILPVKNQRGWLHHFLKEITRLYRKTKDDNFFVNLVDFESDDVDVAEMIRASGVSEKINFISKTGPFHKTLAIQDAASRVPSPDDIVFLFDLHIDIPLNLLENVRKVSSITAQRSSISSSCRTLI